MVVDVKRTIFAVGEATEVFVSLYSEARSEYITYGSSAARAVRV